MNETVQVWNEFSNALRSFIRRRVSDEHAADDLLQEVFIRIHHRLESLNSNDRLASWIFQIARNVVTDFYRKNVRETAADSFEPESCDELSTNLNEQVGQWLVDRIDELPESYREILTMTEVEGIKQAEVARRIGLSNSGAKSRVQRGRKMLKQKLLDCCHFEFDRRGNVIDYTSNTMCATCCERSDCNGSC